MDEKAGLKTERIILRQWQQKDLEKNHQILGYGSLLRKAECPLFLSKNIPEINAIWIDENHRNQGLGTALIRWIEDLAVREKYEQIARWILSIFKRKDST